VNADFGNTTIITGDATITAGTGNKHYVQNIGSPISGTGKLISSMLICRIFRDVTVANDYPASVGLMEIDFHYKHCGLGSGTQYFK
jgi:hypothetical protein